jgi:hypothetical protein
MTRRNRCRPGVVNRTPQTGFIDGDDRTSQVPEEPLYERALLFDPGGIFALGRYRASMLPSAFTTASASAISIISGLNHTARSLAVYASQGELPHRHALVLSTDDTRARELKPLAILQSLDGGKEFPERRSLDMRVLSPSGSRPVV